MRIEQAQERVEDFLTRQMVSLIRKSGGHVLGHEKAPPVRAGLRHSVP